MLSIYYCINLRDLILISKENYSGVIFTHICPAHGLYGVFGKYILMTLFLPIFLHFFTQRISWILANCRKVLQRLLLDTWFKFRMCFHIFTHIFPSHSLNSCFGVYILFTLSYPCFFLFLFVQRVVWVITPSKTLYRVLDQSNFVILLFPGYKNS